MKGLIAAMRWLRPALPVVAIAVLGVLVYSSTFEGPFVFDDKRSILENTSIRDWTDLGSLWRSNPTRFVLYFSLALNYRLGGVEVFGYHLVNLAIHLGAALLAYGLVRLIYVSPWARSLSPEAIRRGSQVALLSALFFVAHPVQTQAVTYVVQRAESLAAFFYLLALVLYAKGRQLFFSSKLKAQSSKQLSAFSFWLSALFCAALGMLTKETVASLPAALLLYEVCFLRSSTPPPFFRSLTVTAPIYGHGSSKLPSSPAPPLLRSLAPLLPFCLLPFLPLLLSTGGELELPSQSGALSRGSYLATQCRVLVTYLRLLLLPIGQNLDYDYPAHDSLGEPVVLGSLLLLASLPALAVWAFRRRRVLAFAILWFFVTLSVTSSVIPILDVIYEHRLYLATLGYGLFLSYALLRVGERWGEWGGRGAGENVGAATVRKRKGRGMALAVLFLLVAAYALAAHQRNRLWGDEVGLWRDCAAKSPRKARPHNNLGNALLEVGRYEEAISYLQTAIALRPSYPEAYNNLGLAYEGLKRDEDALREYQRAVELNPQFPDARINLGVFYEKRGQNVEAFKELQMALSLAPHRVEVHNNLGNLYLKEGKYVLALAAYQKVLALNPQDPTARTNLGALWLRMGHPSRAVEEYQAVLSRDPTNFAARSNLGFAYYRLGKLDRAIAEQKRVLTEDPEFANGYYGLALAYEKKGMTEEAAAAWEEYLRRSPPHDPWVSQARKHLQELRAGGQR